MKNRVPELDGVRGLAILLVLGYHGFEYSMQSRQWAGLPHVVASLTAFGGTGVDLFFVLSGYLITGILLDSAGANGYFRNFYARRALRILPLYYLILITIWVVYPNSDAYVLLGVFYLTNLSHIFGVAAIYGPLWSLSVEEHFYLIWPSLVSKLRLKGVVLLSCGIILVEPLFRVIENLRGLNVGIYYYSWFRFDGLAAGALVACFVRSSWYSKERLYYLGLAAFGGFALLSAIIPPTSQPMGYALVFSCVVLLYSGLLSTVVSGGIPPITRLMQSRWLRRCGELSYCLYIVHWLVFYEFDRIFEPNLASFEVICVRAFSVYLVSYALAELSYRYFEGPILRLKRHFEPRSVRALTLPVEG